MSNMSLEQLIANGPGGDTADTTNTAYIGVPDGYMAAGTSPSTAFSDHLGTATHTALPTGLPPQYPKGSELSLRGMSPEAVARIQQGLALTGLIGPSTRYHLGVADPTTVSSYRTLLGYANQGGITAEEALQQLIANPIVKGDGSSGSGTAAPVYQTRTDVVNLQDPATLRAAAHAAFKETTGRGRRVDDKKVQQFVDAFTRQQAAVQEKVNQVQDTTEASYRARAATAAAGGDPGSAPISQQVNMTQPDMQSRASEFAQQQAPAETGAYGIAKQFDGFLKMLGGVI